MSIWEDCEEHGGVPFFGFPVKPSFKDGVFQFEFPLGYEPNGSQTKEVAEKLNEMLGGEIIQVTDKIIQVRVDPEKLSYVIYDQYMTTNR